MTKYGYTTIGIICVFVFILLTIAILVNNNILKILFAVSGVGLLAFTINFFRDPDRTIPNEKNIVVSPADGRVLLIKEVVDTKYINSKCWQVSIFMSPMNVHVNRIPVSGKVEYLKYIPGEYLIASDDKASERNERTEIGILSENGKVLFTQVAGFIARRIIYEIKEGEGVKIGERFGMIKFGSRVDVLVPSGWIPNIKKDDNVVAGETILFRLGK